jgi:hypothetical protein
MAKLVFGLCAFFALAAFCAAQESLGYMNGNRLLEQCDTGAQQQKLFCSGYVAGVMDTQVTLFNSLNAATNQQRPSLYCLPKGGIEVGQAVRVTIKWLKDHPEKLHIAGDILVGLALQEAFPCK